MTHRDELLALRARLEAQARELDEAKTESELLRVANAQKTREIERLRSELEAAKPNEPSLTPDPWGNPTERPEGVGSVSRARAAAHEGRELRRPFAVAAMAMAATALLGAFVVALSAPHRPRRARATEATIAARVGTVRLGTVIAGDPAVAAEGTACAVSISPVEGSGYYDCRVEVRCGDRALYGATPDTGYVHCGDREILRDANFTVRDGDPAMELDFVTDRLVVEEQLGLGTQRVEIALSP